MAINYVYCFAKIYENQDFLQDYNSKEKKEKLPLIFS